MLPIKKGTKLKLNGTFAYHNKGTIISVVTIFPGSRNPIFTFDESNRTYIWNTFDFEIIKEYKPCTNEIEWLDRVKENFKED